MTGVRAERRSQLIGRLRLALVAAAISGLATAPIPLLAQQQQTTRAPGAGASPRLADVTQDLPIGAIVRDNAPASGDGYRAYVFRPSGNAPIQIDAVSNILDTVIEVYEPDGKQPIARDDDSGEALNARVVLTGGPYKQPLIVVVRDANGAGGSFSLTAARLAGVNATSQRLTVGKPFEGTFDKNSLRRAGLDYPYARHLFTAHAGQRVQIDVHATDFDPRVVLYRGSGRIGLDTDSGPGLDARMLRVLREGGEYTLDVESPDRATVPHGAYSIRISEAAPATAAVSVGSINPGERVEGVLAVASALVPDTDQAYAYHRFTGEAGKTYTVKASVSNSDAEGDPGMLFLDAGASTAAGFAKAVAGTTDRTQGATLEIVFIEAGEVLIRVMSELDWRGSYTVSVRPKASPS